MELALVVRVPKDCPSPKNSEEAKEAGNLIDSRRWNATLERRTLYLRAGRWRVLKEWDFFLMSPSHWDVKGSSFV